MIDVLLDTNIFVKLDEDQVLVEHINKVYRIFSTNAQLSEIRAIENPSLRERRLLYYNSLQPIKLNLKSGIWIDKLFWDDEQPWIDDLGEVFQNIRGNSNKENTLVDALIAEVAKHENLILVTDEIKIQQRAGKQNIDVMNYQTFIESLKK